MKPAPSIVFFTTASGAGYGMLIWLGLLATLGKLPDSRWFGLAALALALTLVTLGLLASTAHLGRPGRAWRAVTQWRSSWLSREGIAALLTYVPAGLLGLSWLTVGRPAVLPALLAAVMAVVTVVCTAMIYASLKPIRQWNNSYVAPFYLLAALFSGAICLSGVFAFADGVAAQRLALAALVFGIAAAVLKFAYWRHIDTVRPGSTMASATGLGKFGTVRSFEAPHVEENYLLREFAFRIARKHAARLRAYALVAAFALPVALLVGVLLGPVPAEALAPASVIALFGLLLERWLFFAEATHTVGLFYGRG